MARNVNCGVDAWAIIEAYGNVTQSSVTDINRDAAWTAVSMKSVGIAKRTPLMLRAHIIQLNNERADAEKYTEDQMTRKFLSLLSFPLLVRNAVTLELQTPQANHLYPAGTARLPVSAQHPGGLTLVGTRHFIRTAGWIQELWDLEFAGGRIKPEAAP